MTNQKVCHSKESGIHRYTVQILSVFSCLNPSRTGVLERKITDSPASTFLDHFTTTLEEISGGREIYRKKIDRQICQKRLRSSTTTKTNLINCHARIT